MDRERDVQRGRRTDRQTDRQRKRERDRDTETVTDRQRQARLLTLSGYFSLWIVGNVLSRICN